MSHDPSEITLIKKSYSYNNWKLRCLIFERKEWHVLSRIFDECKVIYLIFLSNVKVFTVTFDQFIVSLLNKSKMKNKTDLKFLTEVYIGQIWLILF